MAIINDLQHLEGSVKRHRKPAGDGSTVMLTSLSLILLAFFILLYALSSPNKVKQQKVAFEVKQAFNSITGILGKRGSSREKGHGLHQGLEINSAVESFISDLQGYAKKDRDLSHFSYEITRESLLLHIPGKYIFRSGSAQLESKAYPFLNKILDMVSRSPSKIRIEGHTDDIPLQHIDSWKLSAMRATSVLRYFLTKKKVPASRFSVAGFGSTRPIASNRLSEGRAKNRRVTVVFINPFLIGEERGPGS